MATTALVFLTVCVGAALTQSESMVVQIDQGPVRGYLDPRGDFYSFLEVPYATAPTGTNKFKASLPPPVWTEPFEAVQRNIACPQLVDDDIAAGLTIQEDCLVANVFVPDTNATNLPVLVSVHGGGYVMGASFFFHYTDLVRYKKAIVVTFNYRVGILGYLCLGTEDIPGNAAMKDQVTLLRWVNRNIASFGGNPDDVTITGCSAGGGSVDFLTISPMATGLFRKAITESGSVFGLTGPQADPVENAKKYAIQLNFNNVDDLTALDEFYKTISYELLLSRVDYILEAFHENAIRTAPCVERETGNEMFLYDTPINILKNGNYQKVPLLYSYAELEGLVHFDSYHNYSTEMNYQFSKYLPTDLQFESETQKEEVAARVKKFYFGDQRVGEETLRAFIDYFTDITFAYPMLRAAGIRRASQNDQIFLFEYNYLDESTPFILNTDVRGPGHCYQLFAVTDEDVSNATEEYKTMKETMRQMWLDFIITGNPAPENSSIPAWPPVSGVASPFMSLNQTSRLDYSSLHDERMRFWDTIYDEHYVPPLPPTDSASASTMSLLLLAIALVPLVINSCNK